MPLGGGCPLGAAAAPEVLARTSPLCSWHAAADHAPGPGPGLTHLWFFTTLREPDVSFREARGKSEFQKM